MDLRHIVLLVTLICLSSCSVLGYNTETQQSTSSSLVDFLYPAGTTRVSHEHDVPVITLPVNVGIAFVPSNHWRTVINEKTQMDLLMAVKNRFAKHEYVNRIELIPTSYLKQGQGFITLKQVARMHDVDVMALVSYDQLIQSYEKEASLLYWTIVGMYFVQGNENTIQTFVDTAVFDIDSEKLLFRAPGASKSRDRSTAIELEEQLHHHTEEGFEHAFSRMTDNLEAELEQFTTRVKEEKIIRVEARQGYTGGALHWIWILCLSLLTVSHRYYRGTNQHTSLFCDYNAEKPTYRSYQNDIKDQQYRSQF